MNAPAKSFTPYTPDAIARIRAGASAADLGWSQAFYERICRERGLDPIPERTKVRQSIAAPVNTEGAAPPSIARGDLIRRILVERYRRNERREIVFEWDGPDKTECARRIDKRHTLNLMLMLCDAEGEFVSVRTFAAATDISEGSAQAITGEAARDLRNMLAGTPFDLVSKAGHSGGHRLAYASSQEPALVRVVSIGGVMIPPDEGDA